MNAEATNNPRGFKNTIFASLPQKERERLHAALESVSLKFGQVLYEPGKRFSTCTSPSIA